MYACIAELEDGLRLLVQLTSVAVKNLKIGMSVRVENDRTVEGRLAYKFELLQLFFFQIFSVIFLRFTYGLLRNF